MSRFVHESLWNLVWFTIGFLKWNGWERFSSDLQIESSRQENVTKPRCAQISPKQKSWFFVTFLTKGLWGWSWEGGRAFHDLYSTYRHFWQILYKLSTGVSSTSTSVIYAFITPNPASKSSHWHTSFSMQTSQVNFLPFHSSHKKLTHLRGVPPTLLIQTLIHPRCTFFSSVFIPAAQFVTISLSHVGWAFHIQFVYYRVYSVQSFNRELVWRGSTVADWIYNTSNKSPSLGYIHEGTGCSSGTFSFNAQWLNHLWILKGHCQVLFK